MNVLVHRKWMRPRAVKLKTFEARPSEDPSKTRQVTSENAAASPDSESPSHNSIDLIHLIGSGK